LFETEIGQLAADSFAQLRNQLLPQTGKRFACAPKLTARFLQGRIDPGQFGIALFKRLQFLPRLFSELNDLIHGRAVLAFEGVDQVHALLQLAEARWVQIDLVVVMG
jgi:hypothetical protein